MRQSFSLDLADWLAHDDLSHRHRLLPSRQRLPHRLRLRHRHRSQRRAGHLARQRLPAWGDDPAARVGRDHRRARGGRARHHARAARCELRQRLRRVGLQPADEVADVLLGGAAHRRLAHLHVQGVLVQGTLTGYRRIGVLTLHVYVPSSH